MARQGRSAGSARSARRNRRSAARSSPALEHRHPRRRGRRRRTGAGQDHLVLAGEVPAQQIPGGPEAGRARVEAAEQQPRQRPGQLGGEDPLGRGMKAADVERARVAQGHARGARSERLVDVDDVEGQAPQRVLDRPGHVDGQRGRTAPRRRERQHLTHPEHHRLAVGLLEHLPARGSLAGCPGPARSNARGRSPARGGPARQLIGHARDVFVDLALNLPGERRHLRDGEAPHDDSMFQGGAAARPVMSALAAFSARPAFRAARAWR